MANATHKPNDPKGEAGSKKTPLGLIPPSAMEEIAWVHQLGSVKYGELNWRKTGVCASTYVHAILRHLNAWRDGEDLDPESGRSHIAHVACCCNILLDAAACGTLDDDRNKRPQTVHETIESANTRCKVCSKPMMYHYIYGWCCEECDFTDPYFEP